MEVINYFSNAIIPIIISIIIIFGLKEKVKVFDCFLEGAKEGMQIVIGLLPTLIGLFVAIGILRESGAIEIFIEIISPIIEKIGVPKEIMPLAFFRPVSGSASIAIGTDLMENYGVDSQIGTIASIIMGSTETTLYTIAIYTSAIKIKKTRGILFPALIGDIVGMLISVGICRFLS